MQENKTLSRAEWLDKIFGTPVFAVLLAIFCNVLWGSAFPFIKLGYRLFAIDSSSRAACPSSPAAKWQRSAVLWACGRPRPSTHSITSLLPCSRVPLAAS